MPLFQPCHNCKSPENIRHLSSKVEASLGDLSAAAGALMDGMARVHQASGGTFSLDPDKEELRKGAEEKAGRLGRVRLALGEAAAAAQEFDCRSSGNAGGPGVECGRMAFIIEALDKILTDEVGPPGPGQST